MAYVRIAAKLKQLNDANFFLMDAKDIETTGGVDLQTVLDGLSGDAIEDIEELKQIVGNEAGTDPETGDPIEASGLVKDVDELQVTIGTATVVDDSDPDNTVTTPGTGLIKDIEDILETIGADAVMDDSNPDEPVEVSPATGMKKDIADLKERMESNVCDVDKIEYTPAEFVDIENVKVALDQLFADVYYVTPEITSFTTTPGTLTVEIGSTIDQIDFEWAVNKEMTEITLTDCVIADATVTTASYTTPLTADKTFTLTATDGKETATSTKSVKFLPYVYYGKALAPDTDAGAAYDDIYLLELPSKALKSALKGDYTMTLGVDEYGYIAAPTSFGTPVVKIGGFETELDLVATFEHTNASGYAQEYNVFRTGNSNLGSITMVVS